MTNRSGDAEASAFFDATAVARLHINTDERPLVQNGHADGKDCTPGLLDAGVDDDSHPATPGC